MGYNFQGIFANTQGEKITGAAKKQWPFCMVKHITSPFEGIGITRSENEKDTEGDDDSDPTEEYMRFENELAEFSKQFPHTIFIYVWAACQGSTCFYDGFACKNGHITIDNRGEVTEPFSQSFQKNKLRTLVGALGIQLDANALFEPLTRGFFPHNQQVKKEVQQKESPKQIKSWWKFW